MESAAVSFTYPIIIFDVDISSLVTEVPHHVSMATLSCHMQGSPLMERNKVQHLNAISSRFWYHVTYSSWLVLFPPWSGCHN